MFELRDFKLFLNYCKLSVTGARKQFTKCLNLHFQTISRLVQQQFTKCLNLHFQTISRLVQQQFTKCLNLHFQTISRLV